MQRDSLKLWAAAGLSAGLLELPFPLAGPMPPWRSVFAWFALVPLLCAILSRSTVERRRPLRAAHFFWPISAASLWYCGNCYWIRDTMAQYGDMPPLAPTLLLLGFSLVLGLYFGLFGWSVMLGAPSHWQHATGTCGCASSVDGAGTRRCAHHKRSLGPTRLLAGRQRPGEPTRAVDRRLRHQLLLLVVNALLAGAPGS